MALFNCSVQSVVTSSPADQVYVPDHLLSAFNAMTSLLASVGNAAILIAFRANPRLLDKSFNVLILNLTVADLAVGLLDVPWKVCPHLVCTVTIVYFTEKLINL